MRIGIGASVTLFGLAFFVASGSQVRAQVRAQDKLRRDRLNIVGDVTKIVLGTAAGNPGLALGATARLGYDAYKYDKHKKQALAAAGGPSMGVAAPAQAESLVAVAGRPGYYFYPSNPGQLYIDPAQGSDPMRARVGGEARPDAGQITVRIDNTAKDGRSVDYTVDGTAYTVPAGYTQVLTAAPGSVIAYDRGNLAGVERYTLASGAYQFRRVDNGWRFYADDPSRSVAARAGVPAAR